MSVSSASSSRSSPTSAAQPGRRLLPRRGITFLAVVVSARKISRLNVVAAVRDIPDVCCPAAAADLVWGASARDSAAALRSVD